MAARTKLTPKKKALFLTTLIETCQVKKACEAINMSREAIYQARKRDRKFRKAWEEAYEAGNQTLEDEAHRRARDGVDKPVFHHGKIVGTVRDYSDVLLIFLMKGREPKRWREQFRHEHTGANGGPIKQVNVDAAISGDDAAKAYKAMLEAGK